MPNMEMTKSYIYDLDNHKFLSDSYCLISGIGYEYRVNHSNYSTDCMNAPRNECTFQYTVSGEGALVINKKIHLLHAGQAFLVEKPGQFRYYLPKSSSHWEFKWISMNVPSIFYWQEITDHYGRIVKLSENSPTMQYWKTIYTQAGKNAIGDVFLSSAHAYTFIMHLHQDLWVSQASVSRQDIFQNCLQTIHRQYADPSLSLNTLAEELNVSSSYLSKIFKLHMKKSYIQYLTAHRLNIAREFLISTNLPIETIAAKVGFPDANYFSRIFRKQNGISPSQFRQQQSNLPPSSIHADCIFLGSGSTQEANQAGDGDSGK